MITFVECVKMEGQTKSFHKTYKGPEVSTVPGAITTQLERK